MGVKPLNLFSRGCNFFPRPTHFYSRYIYIYIHNHCFTITLSRLDSLAGQMQTKSSCTVGVVKSQLEAKEIEQEIVDISRLTSRA